MKWLLPLALVLLIPASLLAEPLSIRILHLNDFHGFVRPTGTSEMSQPLGGAARLAEKITRLRAEKPSLLLSAGDMIQGDSWANLSSGASVIELMNLLKFDAMTTGNHEFDFGQEILGQRIRQASFPVLAANVSGFEALKPYTIIERGGVRIGIIGLVTDDTPETSHPRNTTGLIFSKPLDRAAGLVRELRGKTDLIVLLTHLGHSEDRALAEKLSGPLSAAPHASMLMGNLLIIGGHSHTRVEQPVKIGSGYVAQAWEHGKTLGVIDVTVDNGRITSCSGRLDEITPDLGDGDARVADLVKSYDEKSDAALNRIVGVAGIELQQAGIRQKETNLGNLIADIIRETSGAQAAIVNGGSIRTGIRQGPVSMRDIYAVLPFNNYIVAVRMSGRQLREALEHGVSGVEKGEGRFPQVSGLKFSFDASRAAGKRVGPIFISGTALEDNRDYVVATLDFMAAGGDGYQAFGAAIRSAGDYSETGGALHSSRLVYNDPGRWLRDIVAGYLEKNGTLGSRPEGRIMEQR
jgi:2',3'-cyclic-nucleotide 2'-phosphodiesterase (5'-nucleotidase family)